MAEKILALSLMGIFYAAYLGKKLAQSRQGITTNQIGKGKVTDAETGTPRVSRFFLKMPMFGYILLRTVNSHAKA